MQEDGVRMVPGYTSTLGVEALKHHHTVEQEVQEEALITEAMRYNPKGVRVENPSKAIRRVEEARVAMQEVAMTTMIQPQSTLLQVVEVAEAVDMEQAEVQGRADMQTAILSSQVEAEAVGELMVATEEMQEDLRR